MKSFEQYRIQFANFYQAVKMGHANAPVKNGAHGLDHDVTVAMMTTCIAPDERTADKAWCAGMLHSIDRQFGRWNNTQEKENIERQVAAEMCRLLAYLPEDFFSVDEKEEIYQAALRHSEMNQDDQSLTQHVLMDADRLANLQMATVIRSAQMYHDKSALEFEWINSVNPESTYSKPRSVLDNLRWDIKSYLPQMRIPVAKNLAAVYAKKIEAYIAEIKENHDNLGLTGVIL